MRDEKDPREVPPFAMTNDPDDLHRVGPGVTARDPSFQPDVRISRIRLIQDCALMRARDGLDEHGRG